MKMTKAMADSWLEQLLLYHHGLLFDKLTPQQKENLSYLIEGMTNIDTPEKMEAFNVLCECYPSYDVVLVPKKAP